MNSRQGLPRTNISNLSEINSWKHLSGSAIILVPTVGLIFVTKNFSTFFTTRELIRHQEPHSGSILAYLEAEQRFLSYCAILVAIVSQNLFVLVFMGYRTIIARYVAKWGFAQMCLCETKYQVGYRTILGEC